MKVVKYIVMKKDIVIWSKKLIVEPMERTIFRWPSNNNEYLAVVFRKAYSISHQDWQDGINNVAYRVHERKFRTLSFAYGETLETYEEDNYDGQYEIKQYPDGTKFLFVNEKIPTFDSYDLDWDGARYISVYRDNYGINLIHCRYGDKISSIDIYLELTRSVPALSKWFKYIDCDDFVDDYNDDTLEKDEIYQIHQKIYKKNMSKKREMKPQIMNDEDFVSFCEFSNVQEIEEAIKNGANVNARNDDNQTALYYAAYRKNDVNVVELLLKHGADINARLDNDWTVLQLVSFCGYTKIVKVLLKYGADVNAVNKQGRTSLSWASDNGCSGVVELLLKNDADVNTRDEDGYTALHWASNARIARLLLKYGANVNAGGNDGNTPLQTVIFNEHIDSAEVILEHGAEVNARDKDGLTALHFAAEEDQKDAVELLLKYRANVNAKDNAGRTALDIAEEKRNADIAKLLRAYIQQK